jgi:hypothetical protein
MTSSDLRTTTGVPKQADRKPHELANPSEAGKRKHVGCQVIKLGQGICYARPHSRAMNKVGAIRPSAERRYNVREAFPEAKELRGGSGCALLRRSP